MIKVIENICVFVIITCACILLVAFLDKILPEYNGEIVMGTMIGVFFYETIKGFLRGVKNAVENKKAAEFYRREFMQELGAEGILKND